MILIYPMLTSESVNQTLLPGIIKAVEKYIIIHNTNEVLSYMNNAIGDVVKSSVTGLVAGAATAGIAYAVDKYLKDGGGQARIKQSGKSLKLEQMGSGGYPGGKYGPISSKSNKQPMTPIEKGAKVASQSIENAAKSASIKGFDMPRMDTVSLEPTWVQVQTSMGARLIGVKVVPFKVASTTGMVGLLMNDKELKRMDYMSTKMLRMTSRVFYRAMRGLKVPGFKDKVISGNPKKDIVLAQSQYGKNTFVCFSKLDIEKDEIFQSPAAVQKLQKLGWASIIVTDDVNKQATFCMKQFGGVCSTIPYSFIFSSLGKEHSQVYKDLEDASRSAGPFFRKKSTTKRKIFSK